MTKSNNKHVSLSLTSSRTKRLLTQFRLDAEAEAETSIANIPTTLALALADVAEALDIKDPMDVLNILGPEAYLTVYWDPIPYQPATPPHHAVHLLLAKLRDTWRGRWAEAFPVPPPA